MCKTPLYPLERLFALAKVEHLSRVYRKALFFSIEDSFESLDYFDQPLRFIMVPCLRGVLVSYIMSSAMQWQIPQASFLTLQVHYTLRKLNVNVSSLFAARFFNTGLRSQLVRTCLEYLLLSIALWSLLGAVPSPIFPDWSVNINGQEARIQNTTYWTS